MSNSPRQPSEGNKAFVVAASVLGLVAIAQLAAVVWHVATFEPTRPSIRTTVSETLPMPQAPSQAVDSQPSSPSSDTPTLASRTHSIANISTIDPATVTPPLGNQAVDGIAEKIAIQNKAALFYLDQGMAARNEGDMLGALGHFTSAASLEKNHPRVLYEFAVTYEEMGHSKKAANFWKTIYEMGPVIGGDYFALADFRLKGQAPKMELSAPTGQKALEIADVVAERDEEVAAGERIVLHILIKSVPNATVSPHDVHVRVDFYDKVNDAMVDLTRAVPSNRWVTQPVDWQAQAEELLEVTYFLPPQTDEDILDFGHRVYHGHVIKVYHQDQLQDVFAEPRTLLDFNAQAQDSAPHSNLIHDSFFPR